MLSRLCCVAHGAWRLVWHAAGLGAGEELCSARCGTQADMLLGSPGTNCHDPKNSSSAQTVRFPARTVRQFPVLACCVSSEAFAARRPSSVSACRGKPQPIAKHHHTAPLNSLASSICPRLHPLSCAVSRSLTLSSTSNCKNIIHRSKNPRAPPHGFQIHHTQGLSNSLSPSTAPQTRAPTTISPGIADLAAASSSSARTRPHRGIS